MSFRVDGRLTIAITARGVSFLGDLVATLALTFRLAPHGAGAVAALLACNLVPIVVLSGVAGRLADSLDERVLLATTGAVQALLCLGLVVPSGPGVVYTLVTLLGAGQAVNGATWQAVIPALASPGQLARALSRNQMAVTAAGVAAPALGGVLVAAAGTHVPLLIDVASFVVVAACGLAIGRVRGMADPARDRTGGWTIVRCSPVLRAALTLMGGMLLLGCMVNVVEVFLVRSVLHAGAAAYGLCGAAYSAAALLGALWAGRFAGVRAQAVWLVRGGVVIGVGLALMGLAPTVGALAAVSVLAGAANGVISVTAAGVLLGSAAPETRGRVGAVMAGVFSAAQLASSGLAAALSLVLDPRGVFLLGGLAASVFALARARALLDAVGIGRTRRPIPLTHRVGDSELAWARRAVTLPRPGRT